MTAQQWFKGLELDVVELPVLTRSDATSATNVELAEQGGLFYLTGGDLGLVVAGERDARAHWRSIGLRTPAARQVPFLPVELKIVRASALESRLPGNESLDRVFGARGMRSVLIVPAAAQKPRPKFLEYHQARVFRGWPRPVSPSVWLPALTRALVAATAMRLRVTCSRQSGASEPDAVEASLRDFGNLADPVGASVGEFLSLRGCPTLAR